MGGTDAARQRRYRAHKRGNHSLCDQTRCGQQTGVTVTPAVTRVTRDAEPACAPAVLGTRGRRLWLDVTAGAALTPERVVLLEEACRIADRLDRLDAILRGDSNAWMTFTVNEGDAEVTVIIDKALSEARQQATVLKQLVAELRQSAGKAQPAGQGVGGLDQLAARRAERIAGTAGR